MLKAKGVQSVLKSKVVQFIDQYKLTKIKVVQMVKAKGVQSVLKSKVVQFIDQ